jgi:hypothetical protein
LLGHWNRNVIPQILHKVADRAGDFLIFVCRERYEGLRA